MVLAGLKGIISMTKNKDVCRDAILNHSTAYNSLIQTGDFFFSEFLFQKEMYDQ